MTWVPRISAAIAFCSSVACGPSPPGLAGGASAPESGSPPEEEPEYASLADYTRRTERMAKELAAIGFVVDTSRLEVALVDDATAQRELLAQTARAMRPELWELLVELRKMAAVPDALDAASLRVMVAKHVAEKTLAYYDWTSQRLVFRDLDATQLAELDAIVVHELVHAYQDQKQGGVEAFLTAARTSFDATRAARAVMEGQAVLTAGAVMLARQHARLDDVDPALLDDSLSRVVTGPGLGTLYTAGERFMLQRYRAAGWKGVAEAYAHPPTSSEQVLHPRKLGHDLPQTVAVPRWPRAAGEATLVSEEVVGELLLRGALSDGGAPPEQVERVTTGWDGDRLAVYRTGDGQLGALWRTVWDRAVDAEQFAAEMKRWSERQRSTRLGVRRRGCVVDVAHAPDGARLEKLGAALGRSTPRAKCSSRDAPGTAAAEAEQQQRATAGPRVENGVWIHQRHGIAITIPPGWQVVEVNGVELLVGRQRTGFAENVVVLEEQDLLRSGLEGYLARTAAALRGNPHQKILSSKVTELRGRPVGIVELEAEHQGLRLRIVSVVVQRPGRFVVVSMGFFADDFADRKGELGALLRGLRIDP